MAQTTASIDPRTLDKWEDAFQYPIGEVRLMERKLRSDLSVNQEKLRGLVGQSYRELLRTADRIVQMDSDVHRLERHFGEITRQCNWRAVNRKSKNLRGFTDTDSEADRARTAFAAQMGTLLASPSTIAVFLQAKEFDAAVQLLVIAKLLQTNLSTEGNAVSLKKVARQLGALESIVEKELKTQLSNIEASQVEVGRLLTSLSLLRGFSSKQVLERFLEIRSVKIFTILSTEESSLNSLLLALKLINKTVKDGEYIFPKRLSDSLLVVKGRPVIASDLLKSAHSLRLDSVETSLPQSIRDFRPSMSHDDLKQSYVDKIFSDWIASELDKFHDVFLQKIDGVSGLRELLIFRKELLRVWASNRSKFAMSGPVAANPPRIKYRDGLKKRASEILKTQAGKLADIGELLKQSDKGSRNYSVAATSGLWSSALVNMDIHNGARNFKNEILNQLQGRSPDIKEFQELFDKWSEAVAEALDSVKNMQKLQSSIEVDHSTLDDYDLELGDEEADEELEDMKTLEIASKGSVEDAFKSLENELAVIASDIIEASKKNSSGILQRSAFLLRAIRALQGYKAEGVDVSTWFCTSVHHSLNKVIAEHVSFTSLATYRAALKRRAWNYKPDFDSLREGQPPLPTQPTPITFTFLIKLLVSMTELGDDVWTKDAVEVLVAVATNVLSGIYKAEIEGRTRTPEPTKSEPTTPKDAITEEESKEETVALDKESESTDATETAEPVPVSDICPEWHDHVLFDALLLDKVLGESSNPEPKLLDCVKSALRISESDTSRLSGNVEAYWKRTSLLFSLYG